MGLALNLGGRIRVRGKGKLFVVGQSNTNGGSREKSDTWRGQYVKDTIAKVAVL